MKKKIILCIFCIILVLGGSAHYYYTHSSIIFGYVLFPPMMLFISLLPPKSIRMPDYSATLSFIGILGFILSYMIYFSHFEIWQNDTAEVICLLVFVVYTFFLAWYKGETYTEDEK